jgi:hypothetical protein
MGSVHGDSGAPGVRVGLAECPHLRRPGRNQPFEKRPASCWLESFRIADRHVVQFVSQGRDLCANRVSGGQNEQTGDKELNFMTGSPLSGQCRRLSSPLRVIAASIFNGRSVRYSTFLFIVGAVFGERTLRE